MDSYLQDQVPIIMVAIVHNHNKKFHVMTTAQQKFQKYTLADVCVKIYELPYIYKYFLNTIQIFTNMHYRYLYHKHNISVAM